MKKKNLFLLIPLLILLAMFSFEGCNSRKKVQSIILNPAKVGSTTFHFYDKDRNRPLVTDVWYPVDENAPSQLPESFWVRCPEAKDAPISHACKKYPLIVFSHGNGGDRSNNAWLAEILAANNFIVAACDHFGNNWYNEVPECFIKIWDRPKDLSFVIDQMLADSKFGPKVDSGKIGVVGYSLGGQTALWSSGAIFKRMPTLKELPADQVPESVNQSIVDSIDLSFSQLSYKDSRIKAAFLMAPAFGDLFDKVSLSQVDTPVYIVAAPKDLVVPIEKSGSFLASHLKNVCLELVHPGATHYVFLNEVTKGGKLMLKPNVTFDPPYVNRKEIHDDIGKSAVYFFLDRLK